jgi:hypothetical protein
VRSSYRAPRQITSGVLRGELLGLVGLLRRFARGSAILDSEAPGKRSYGLFWLHAEVGARIWAVRTEKQHGGVRTTASGVRSSAGLRRRLLHRVAGAERRIAPQGNKNGLGATASGVSYSGSPQELGYNGVDRRGTHLL